jgi:hypothetical protein
MPHCRQRITAMPVSSSRILAALLVTTLVVKPGFASAKSVCSTDYEAQIRAQYFDGNKLSPVKVDQYIARLKQKKIEISGLITGKEEMKADEKNKPVKQKNIDKALDKSKSLTALDAAITAAESMKSATSFSQICDAATAVSDLEGALRIEGTVASLSETYHLVADALAVWSIPKQSPVDDEASNLLNPETGEAMSAVEIESAVSRGVDLSTLNPVPGSVFYTPVKDISAVDIRQAAYGSTLPLYSGIGNPFPAENTFIYDGIKKTDTKPKIESFVDGDKKTKFKLKFQGEYNADPTVGALMMTLGFPSDITKYAEHLKVILPKGVGLHDVKREWESYFSRDSVKRGMKIESEIESTGRDAKGRTYIIFKKGSIEAHPEALKRLGGWNYADGDHNSRREVRGMNLVQIWLDNSDLKEFENNNTILKQNVDGTYFRTLINSDVGHAFGSLLLEEPNLYFWNMVSSTSVSSIKLAYHNMHRLSIQHKMTLADARWAARMIAKLTRAQIAAAFALGGWPSCIQKTYVERTISRRNNLLQSLGLVGARQDDGTTITLLPVATDHEAFSLKVVCESNPNKKEILDHYQFTATNDIIRPILFTLKRQLFTLAQTATSGERRIVLDSRKFKISSPRPVGEIIININRTIERNPAPTTEQDLFLVKDHMELGVRAGVAVGPYADLIERYSWELAYPARSAYEGSINNGFIVNVLLPRDAREGKLPDSYVLKTEHSFGVETGIEAENLGAAVTPGLKAGVSQIKLWRSIYDHRDGQRAVLYRDRQKLTQADFDIFARVLILKLPVFDQLKNWGAATGKGVILSAEDLTDPAVSNMVDDAVVQGDFSALASKETDFFSDDSFNHSLKKWSLILFRGTTEKRMDRIEINTDQKKNVIQFKTSKGSTSFLPAARLEKTAAVELFADPASPSTMELQVSVMGTNSNTSDKDLAQRYLRFVNGLSVDGKPVLAISPALGYTTNGQWGTTLTQSDTTYSVKAMERILGMSEDAFWNALAASMTIPRQSLNAARSQRGDDESAPNSQREVISHAVTFLKQIARAQRETKTESRLSRLAEAFRQAIFVDGLGFYNPRILGALNRIAGEDAIYSRNLVTVPAPLQILLPEGAPMFGQIGKPMKERLKYLIFSPSTALDLYTMFDSWF